MRFHFSSGLLLALLLLNGNFLRADDFQPEEGYKLLFNCKDFTGWTYYKANLDGKTETADKRFQVVDETIVANEGKGIRDLYTAGEYYGSFHLKMEFRASLKSDSGVYIRGPQLQVRDFIRRGEHKHLANVFKNDDWNELDILVRNNQITTSLNGKSVGPEDALEVTVREGKPKAVLNGKPVEVVNLQITNGPIAVCKINGVQFDLAYKPGTKGGIGLQAEVGKFEFRHIRIKEIP
ncbi:MAG TPA: DUF1080 domain-containing protein [Gemmataceae bacterium]|jgi:hypothetical protein|nr:DUF1080 domain-containing protein [Gemmataceae bacterium]